jgi:hypothetical protein
VLRSDTSLRQASAIDTSNFDPEFTNEPAVDSVVDDSHMVRHRDAASVPPASC